MKSRHVLPNTKIIDQKADAVAHELSYSCRLAILGGRRMLYRLHKCDVGQADVALMM
jgi:hypothetical protein